ncbi:MULTISPECIES: flavin reductase family protein [unclassified Streptomyces]|uniref:flavin reductase family protein n=1 Tax=unclassified Streptomyces TaxID=2593676 RepID=UPI0033A779E9
MLPSANIRTFRAVLGQFATGVTVITGLDGDEPVGLTCQSFSSLSLDPPLVLFCPGHSSTSWPRIRPSGHFGVNILAEDQREVCKAFGSTYGPKFDAVGSRRSPGGTVILDGVLAWLGCAIEAVYDGGDHDIVVGRVREMRVERKDAPLLYFKGSHDIPDATLMASGR